MSDQAHGAHDDHAHGHGDGVSRFIQHHYDDAQHQFDSGKFGIWLFLAQEVLFFSALFVAYILYRHHHPEIYGYAHKYLDVKYGAINTAVLIFSSLTAAWAVRAAQLNQRKMLLTCIAVTLLCALTFLGIKYIEYSHKYHESILFGRYFDPCVSSGGNPLLTKEGRCAGHESTVVWDTALARATAGCFPDYAVDQDPLREGAQTDCMVQEVKVTTTKGPDGKRVETETPIRPIPDQCPEWRPHGRAGPKKTLPCWRPAFQPAVCQMSWSFSWRDAEAFGFAGPFPSEGDCAKAHKAKQDEVKQAGRPIEVTECRRTHTTGVLVEYGGHDVKPDDLRIKATCKGPPPAKTVEDPFADTQQKLELGKKQEPYQRLSTHELHEREAAGPPPPKTNMFFTIYFAMTGLHGFHVLAGVVVFIWLLIRAWKGHFTPDYFGPIDFAALYWHIVDLIWIFLFPLLYLIH